MVTKRRTRLEMYFDVLLAIKNGKKKGTHIMQKANMSWNTLKSILETLIELDIVKEVSAIHWRDKRIRKYYDFTEKGESMMRYFRDHSQLLEGNRLREFFR